MVGAFLAGAAAMALLVISGLLLALSVFRRGALTFECPGFEAHVIDGDPGRLIRDVQHDAQVPQMCRADDPLACSIRDAVKGGDAARQGNVLLLSGGGQWGAFGAGLFCELSKNSGSDMALPGVAVITGISTGSLQTMMLMVALDDSQDAEIRRFALGQLAWGYSPEKESDVVAHSGLFKVPLFGSAAGTAPLRQRILEALRPDGDNRLIEAIAAAKIAGYAGFVEADSGLFKYADIGALARTAASPEQAAVRLAAVTMASSAMPVFNQQLRVAGSNGKALTYYDGGTRRSVFFDRAMTLFDHDVREAIAKTKSLAPRDFAEAYEQTAPTVYVVRNGPTMRKPEPELNSKSGPLSNGQRGYDLLVNESEIGAIAALRLYNPYGRIMLTSADQYDTFPHTEGENFKDDEMFKPAFMTCLRELGRHKANREGGPWWPLGSIDGGVGQGV
ncbi:patatin-like phospholipase family protein [Qipengyuania marisflavi]|uniref:Patatin-like phospholipase family protein n=1 Tax=Qipengyuania marisflavi TaxID=2486356 RepID=A0A5S3P5X7_9SPHN|nr:patatin-like phospholipase family protein [Qipengyuania marisflavi]TMM48452.1 patatin-like phospholipase family protein [Qipengyuania marisflavi]